MFVPATLALTKLAPAGTASVTTTPPATLGPLFVTLSVYVTFPDASTPTTFATFPIPSCASGVTLMMATFVLFPKFGSYVGLLALATFVSGPNPGATATITRFVTPPAARFPTLRFVVPPPGKTSTTTTLVAVEGPAFVTVIRFV